MTLAEEVLVEEYEAREHASAEAAFYASAAAFRAEKLG
jgi:hypothetical protein